jgi:hypothetical protein
MAGIIYKLALLVMLLAIVVTIYLDWRLYMKKSREKDVGLDAGEPRSSLDPKSSEDTITAWLRLHPFWFWKPAVLLVLFVVALAAHLFVPIPW